MPGGPVAGAKEDRFLTQRGGNLQRLLVVSLSYKETHRRRDSGGNNHDEE